MLGTCSRSESGQEKGGSTSRSRLGGVSQYRLAAAAVQAGPACGGESPAALKELESAARAASGSPAPDGADAAAEARLAGWRAASRWRRWTRLT